MSESIDRLHELKRQELERVFPSALADTKALCSGDAVALIHKSFDQRAQIWIELEEKYKENAYLGNFFSDTIRAIHQAKVKAYQLESTQKDIVKKFRTFFSEVEPGITVDLLVAILIDRCFESSKGVRPGFNIRMEAREILETLQRANDLHERVLPSQFTLEYILRAIFKKQLVLAHE